MKFGDVFKAESPITGKTTNLLDPVAVVQLIMGALLTIFVLATAQNLAKKVEGKLPVDMTIDSMQKPQVQNSMVIY